jgi:hypothetical protein
MPQTEWPSQIDHVFLLANPRREKERCDRLIPHCIERGIPPICLSVCAPTWGDELSSEQIFRHYDPFCRPNIPTLSFKSRCLSKGEISLVLNFAQAALFSIQQKFKTVILLESDVWLRPDFVERLHQILQDAETTGKEWDYISLGEGARTRPEKAPFSMFCPTRLYSPPHQFVFRCTDSMLFRVHFLEKIMGTLFPFRECLDWELNLQAMVHKAKSWWADPPLAEQGTACNRVVTTLTA